MSATEQVSMEAPQAYSCPGCGKPIYSAKVSPTEWRTFERVTPLSEGLGKSRFYQHPDGGGYQFWWAQDIRIGGSFSFHVCPSPASGFFALTMNEDPDIPEYEEAGYATKRPRGWGA
jgi:hypothetical protein